jgi:peptidoglycan/xylan/chitin deacetylase (PgdA/CDA1 family)
MSTENRSMAGQRIAVLINSDTEPNRYLIKLLNQISTSIIFVASEIDQGKSTPSGGRSIFNKVTSLPRTTAEKLFRRIVLKHPPTGPAAKQPIPLDFVGPLDSSSFREALSAFKPNVVLVSGTNELSIDLLETSAVKYEVRLGFQPYYRGNNALELTVAQKNYQYLGITISKTDEHEQAESVLIYVPVIPYPLESFELFKKRVSLHAQELLVAAVLAPSDSSGESNNAIAPASAKRPQADSSTFDNIDNAAASILDMSRFSVANGGVDYSGNRFVKKIVRNRLKRRSIANGWYVLNYHDICADSEFENASIKVPSIYTAQTRFRQHLEYWQNEFNAVSIYEGIELLKHNKLQQDRFLTITFDDGLKSSATAVDSVNAAGFRPTLFLCGDPTANNRPLTNHVNLLSVRLSRKLQTSAEEIREAILKMSVGESIDAELAKSVMAEYVTQHDLSSNLIKGDFDIGAHSMTHARPTGPIDPEQARQVSESIAAISQPTNQQIDLYAHPFGKIADRAIDTDLAAEVHASFHFACSGGVNVLPNPLGAINRIALHNESVDEINELMLMQWGA